MNLLHRYLFREVFSSTIVAVSLFAFVMLGGTALHDIVGRAADGQLTVAQSAEMMALLIPFVLTYALPFGLLTAVLLVLGRVSAQHEITAMRSAGLGLARIAAPVMLIAVLGVASSLVINYVYAPRAKLKYRQLLFEVGQQNPVSLVIPGTFVRDFPGAVVFVGRREADILHDIWLWVLDKQHRVTEFVWVEKGEIRVGPDAEGKEKIALFSHGKVRGERRSENNPEDFSSPPDPVFFDAERPVWEDDLDDIFKHKTFVKKPSWMELGELLEEQERLRSSTEAKDRLSLLDVRINLHEKGSMAFSVLSFALIAVPLGIQTRRKETSANLGLALALTMVFYFGVIAVGWLPRDEHLHPELLLWVPNIIFQALGGWMWWRLGRN